jgi:hypothetical protein
VFASRGSSRSWLRPALFVVLAGAVVGVGGASGSTVSPLGSPHVIGVFGPYPPFESDLAVSPNGWAALVWARDPGEPTSRIQLAVAKPGGRFSRPRTIARVPYPEGSVVVAVSDSGEATVAIPGAGDGLLVVSRMPTGQFARPQWIVRRPANLLGLSLAVSPNGAALLAWQGDASFRSNEIVAGTAWRNPAALRFSKPMSLTGELSQMRVLFVGPDRGVLTGGADRPQVRFAQAGQPFGPPITLSDPTGERAGVVGFVPDREGGLYAAWVDYAQHRSLWAAHVRADGSEQTPTELLTQGARPAELIPARRGRALIVWPAGQRQLDLASLAPTHVSRLPPLSARHSFSWSAAVDSHGSTVVTWTRSFPALGHGAAPALYAVLAHGANAFCPARRFARSTIAPQLALDDRAGGYVLWGGAHTANTPIKAARWNATAAANTNCR